MTHSREDPSAMTMARKKTIRRKVQSTPLSPPAGGGGKKVRRDAGALLSRAPREAARLADEVQRLRSDFDTYVESSRHEIQRLSRRVHQLEQLLKQRMSAQTPAGPTQLATPRAKSLFTFLGRPSLPSLS